MHGKNANVEVGHKRDCAVFHDTKSAMVYNRDNSMHNFKILAWV